MNLKTLTVWSALTILASTMVACEKASPTRPSTTVAPLSDAEAVTDARTGVTMIAARPAAPADGADVPYGMQPLTLSVANGRAAGRGALTYTFEVATDEGFSDIVFSRADVESGDGTTNLAIDRLPGLRTYYWRARVHYGDSDGPYSRVRSFAVGPEIVLGTPALLTPINGAHAASPLALVVSNVSRTGPAGEIVYTVEVASDEGFGNIIYTGTAAENPAGQTAVTAPVNVTSGTTYYWRARATDVTNNAPSPTSATGSFVAQSFDIRTAKFWDNPPDTGNWPVGARITLIEFTGNSMVVDFDRREGPDRWPDVVPPGWDGALQYTLGMCRNVGGEWHCAAVVQFWHGRDLNDTAPASRFWREWWYDGARWGPLATTPPVEGEMVGVFVAAGDLRQRFFTRASCPRVCEISNVVMVPFTSGYARYDF